MMHIFNNANSLRALIIEGIRLQMFIRVNDLYTQYLSREETPLYAWMLFTRDSSTNPRCYFRNHIQGNSNSDFKQVYFNDDCVLVSNLSILLCLANKW